MVFPKLQPNSFFYILKKKCISDSAVDNLGWKDNTKHMHLKKSKSILYFLEIYKGYLHITSTTNCFQQCKKEESLSLCSEVFSSSLCESTAKLSIIPVTNQVSDAQIWDATVNLSSNAAIKSQLTEGSGCKLDDRWKKKNSELFSPWQILKLNSSNLQCERF